MSTDDVRLLLRKRAARFAKRKGSSGVTAWAVHHRIPRSHVSEFLAGKRLPVTRILDALHLEWRICHKRKGSNGEHLK